jgi:catechol 2,3-dioxygenase-like lactoylglutathione lyase family enzyme
VSPQEVRVRIRTHISLEVSDLDESVEFYRRLFAVEPTKTKSDYASFRLAVPPLNLALNKNATRGAAPANVHYGVELLEETALEGWRAKVKERGVNVLLEEDDTVCCYARARKFWVKDPDGHAWEFWHRTAESEERGENPELGDGQACCTPAEKAGGCC